MTKYNMNKKLTALKVIRNHCIKCTGSGKGATLCKHPECEFYIFRIGKNPERAGCGNKHPKWWQLKKGTEKGVIVVTI